MKFIILILIFLFARQHSFCQIGEFDNFYPQDKIFQINKVKKQSDTVGEKMISEYDRFGREIKWYYEENDTTITDYKIVKDTLFQIKFSSEHKREEIPFRVEKYLYNKKGKIIFYSRISNSSAYEGKTELHVSKIYYDQNDKVIALHDFSNYNYPFSVSINYPIIDTLLALTNVYNYFYNSSRQLISKKEMLGKKDSREIVNYFYDSNKRLLKKVSFVKQGFLGEFPFSNINRIEEYKYLLNSTITIRSTKYDDFNRGTRTDIDMCDLTVKYKNGLTKEIYLLRNNEKILAAFYIYEYYND